MTARMCGDSVVLVKPRTCGDLMTSIHSLNQKQTSSDSDVDTIPDMSTGQAGCHTYRHPSQLQCTPQFPTFAAQVI